MDLGIDVNILIEIGIAFIGWTIKRELEHIRASIETVVATVTRAQMTADRAHERIDEVIKDLAHH